MAIQPLSTWKSTLSALPKVADDSWATNFANWYAAQIIAITTDTTVITPVPLGFTLVFNAPLFEQGLKLLTFASPPAGFADAWEAAIITSVYPATLVLLSGATAASGGVFSAVTSVVLTSASIAAAKAKIATIASAPLVAAAAGSYLGASFKAETLGTVGNSISLSFDGVKTIQQVVAAWNAANSGNKVTGTHPDMATVLTAGSVSLSGGLDSKFPEIFRDATLLLEVDVIGVKTPAVAGPLNVNGCPLV